MGADDFFPTMRNGTMPFALDLNAGTTPYGTFGQEFAMNSPMPSSAPEPAAMPQAPAQSVLTKKKLASAQPVAAAAPPQSAPTPAAEDESDDDSPDLSASQYQVTPEELEAARDQKRKIAMIGGIGNALGNMQGWGNFFLGHMNPHTDNSAAMKSLQDAADQPIRDKQALYKQAFQNQQDKLKMAETEAAQNQLERYQDPNSMDSKFGKVLLGRLNGEHNFGLSQDDIKGMNARQVGQFLSQPGVSDIIAGDKAARAFAQQMAIKDKELQAAQARFDAGQGNKDNKDWEGLSNRVNDPSARNQIGRFEQNIQKANALKVMERGLGMKPGEVAPENETREQRIARYNRASPQQLYEIAKAADQLVSNANSTVYGTDHLMPKGMDISMANLRQSMPAWAGGNRPAGANAGEHIDNFMHMAERENGYYTQARDKTIERLAAGYSHLKSKDPQRWNDVLGLNPQQPQQQGSGTQPTNPLQKIGIDPRTLDQQKQKALQDRARLLLEQRQKSKLAGQ